MTTEQVAAALEAYGLLVRDRIEQAIPEQLMSLELRELALDYPRRGGKALRPALCLATCEAFGGRVEHALPSAVAIEMLHNAFLIHDDIEDESSLRRGEPSHHARHGLARAINTGDALTLFAFSALRRNREVLGAHLAERVLDEFDAMAIHTVDGQAVELEWRAGDRFDLTPDDYLELVLKKTCWYTTVLPLRIGALIGSWGTADLDALVRFGFHLGAAFQIRDDILDLDGDPAEFGKDALGDLMEGKRTLMLLHLWACGDPDDHTLIRGHLSRPRAGRRMADALAILEAMRANGSIAFASEFASGVAADAAVSFQEAFVGVPDSKARRLVRDLIEFTVGRRR